MIAEQMRKANEEHKIFNPNDWNKPYAEVDVRFGEFLDWLHQQDSTVNDAVTLALHLAAAYHTKFTDKNLGNRPSPHDQDVLKSVEEAEKRLGLDLLYPPE